MAWRNTGGNILLRQMNGGPLLQGDRARHSPSKTGKGRDGRCGCATANNFANCLRGMPPCIKFAFSVAGSRCPVRSVSC